MERLAPARPLSHIQNLRNCEATKREVSLWKPRLRQMSSRAAAADADDEEGSELQRLVENLSTAEVGNAGVKDMLHQMIVRAADKTDPAVRDGADIMVTAVAHMCIFSCFSARWRRERPSDCVV